tara:strand:- start:634 stop:1203 length:570 start_codon:yes stop_codon:yes gene_type:complete
MGIINGVLDIVLRNPFDDKSKFFKKSKYVFGPRIVLGTVFAAIGVFGFAFSGLAWEFNGLELGLTALITSSIALLFSILFLFPFSKPKQKSSLMQNNIVQVKIKPAQVLTLAEVEEEQKNDENVIAITTAEEIRQQLALSEKEKPEIVMVNFSTKYLLPGTSPGPSKRKPGKSLDTFRESAKELYKSQS